MIDFPHAEPPLSMDVHAPGENRQAFLETRISKAERLLAAHMKRLHGVRSLKCCHDYEPDTCMTEMRCGICGVDANVGAARDVLLGVIR